MNEERSESPDAAERPPAVAIVRWLLVVAAVAGIVAVGMSWVARSVSVASPIPQPDETPGGETGAPAGVGSQASAEDGYPPPDFRLESLDGGTVSPADFAGEVVLVEFWATWCAPCKLQARFIEELHRELDGQGVRFLAVDSGEDADTVREYVERHPFPYPVLLDPEDTLSARYRIYGLPTVMIIDRQGEISYLETGVSDANRLRLKLKEAGLEIA